VGKTWQGQLLKHSSKVIPRCECQVQIDAPPALHDSVENYEGLIQTKKLGARAPNTLLFPAHKQTSRTRRKLNNASEYVMLN
jgi:hypothetical protein